MPLGSSFLDRINSPGHRFTVPRPTGRSTLAFASLLRRLAPVAERVRWRFARASAFAACRRWPAPVCDESRQLRLPGASVLVRIAASWIHLLVLGLMKRYVRASALPSS